MIAAKSAILNFLRSSPLTGGLWRQYLAWRNAPARALIQCMQGESWHRVRLNGVPLLLPAYTLRLYAHCAHGTARNLSLIVEKAHADWMLSKLRAGSLFLDVGASVGTMTVPFAVARPEARIVAFEPARTAREHLLATLRRNGVSEVDGVSKVRVHSLAVSDRDGISDFMEYEVAETCSWLPEASRMSQGGQETGAGKSYEVPVTTLDTMLESFGPSSEVVIKIDVEGYECHVLRGASKLIERHRPYLAIDIHKRIDGPGDTEGGVRELLGASYCFRRLGHVLICEPQVESSRNLRMQ